MSFFRCLIALAVLASTAFPAALVLGEQPFLPSRTSLQSDASWKRLLDMWEEYPCPVNIPATNSLMARMAASPLTLLLPSGWNGGEVDSIELYTLAEHLRVFKLTSLDGKQVIVGLGLWPDSIAAISRVIDFSFYKLGNSTRPNTWWGHDRCFTVNKASFVANYCSYEGETLPNVLFSSVCNSEAVLRSGYDASGKNVGFPPDSFLVDLANKFSSLFRDTTEVTLLRPPEGELTLTVVEKTSESMTVQWQAEGSLSDHWVRVDCVKGELAIDTPDDQPGDSRRVILTNAPHTGTTITLYAISPDGSQWYAKSLPPGDPNGDGKIDILDMIYMRNRMGLDPSNPDNANADVNADGKINVLDFMMVRDWIAEKDVRLYP